MQYIYKCNKNANAIQTQIHLPDGVWIPFNLPDDPPMPKAVPSQLKLAHTPTHT